MFLKFIREDSSNVGIDVTKSQWAWPTYDRKSCLILKVFLLKIFCFKDHHQVAVNYKSIKLTDLFLPMFLSFLNDALYGYIMTLEISIL